MSNSINPTEPQSVKTGWTRTCLLVETYSDARIYADHLNTGWKLDPYLPAVKVDKAFFVNLVYREGEGELADPRIVTVEPLKKEDEILATVEVANDPEAQLHWRNLGYRVVPDKIYQKTSIMKLVAKPEGAK